MSLWDGETFGNAEDFSQIAHVELQIYSRR